MQKDHLSWNVYFEVQKPKCKSVVYKSEALALSAKIIWKNLAIRLPDFSLCGNDYFVIVVYLQPCIGADKGRIYWFECFANYTSFVLCAASSEPHVVLKRSLDNTVNAHFDDAFAITGIVLTCYPLIAEDCERHKLVCAVQTMQWSEQKQMQQHTSYMGRAQFITGSDGSTRMYSWLAFGPSTDECFPGIKTLTQDSWKQHVEDHHDLIKLRLSGIVPPLSARFDKADVQSVYMPDNDFFSNPLRVLPVMLKQDQIVSFKFYNLMLTTCVNGAEITLKWPDFPKQQQQQQQQQHQQTPRQKQRTPCVAIATLTKKVSNNLWVEVDYIPGQEVISFIGIRLFVQNYHFTLLFADNQTLKSI